MSFAQKQKKLYVGSLPYRISEDELRDLFTPYGEVLSVRIVTDKVTGRSKGFGFVEMNTEDEASKAQEALHGASCQGRTLVVSPARQEEKRTGGGAGGGFEGRRRRFE